MKHVIQFQNGFINIKSKDQDNRLLATMVASELLQFGFILDTEAINMLSSASIDDLIEFHTEVITWLKNVTGSNRSYKPFWKGFPQEVMEQSECELWNHQILHYLTHGEYEPNAWTASRPTAFELPNYTKITASDEDRFLHIFTKLVSANQSLTPTDLGVVKWFISSGQELIFPTVVPFKETLTTILGELYSVGRVANVKLPALTTTDILRFAVHLSGGDVSLNLPPKMIKLNAWDRKKSENPARNAANFKKFTRQERKYILSLIENSNCDVKEMVLKANRWIRLGEILHPGEFKTKYAKAYKCFNDLRNEKVVSWYGEVNTAFSTSFDLGLIKLSEKPGEFVRRLDGLVRNNTEKIEQIYTALDIVLPKTSNKVLFEVYEHFEKRLKPVINRTVTIKGARNKTLLPDLPAINKKVVEEIQKRIKAGLVNKMSKLETLGDCWIDERLKKLPVPTNMRSVNAALKPTMRGERVPMGNQNAKVIRAYVHWYDERGTEDLDLTGTYIGMGMKTVVGWNGGKNTKEGCYSGDIRHRKGACAEYIDINVEETLKSGYQYVVLDVRNYNGGSLKSIKDCVFGYMEREHPKANEIFVPATLANTIVLSSDATNTIAVVIDVTTQEYIYLDVDMEGIPVASASFEGIMDSIRPYLEAPKFSVYDLINLHVQGRGQLTTQESATKQFNFDDFSQSYVKILEYMGI